VKNDQAAVSEVEIGGRVAVDGRGDAAFNEVQYYGLPSQMGAPTIWLFLFVEAAIQVKTGRLCSGISTGYGMLVEKTEDNRL